ncbi:MAG: response regulator [Nitrospiraceae bacterium]|nr:response regulator [Nitrospiraceae bacterium]
MAGFGATARILVIDDSRDFQVLVRTYLNGTGWTVHGAADALQATGMALREKPKLILLDIGLPGGDGFMLLDRLHANVHTRGIPVIVTTAQTAAGLEAKAKAKGAQAFLQKPFEKQILLETLESVLRESADATNKPH